MKNARAGSRWLATLIAALGLALGAGSLQAAVTWTNTAGSWNVAANWSPNQVPTDGDDVVITNTGASVLLAGSSSNLSSLLLSKTLTFTNWDTKLTATNVTILSGGNATCSGPFTNNAMSNRVWIVCTNFFLNSSASINVVGKGFSGSIVNGGDGQGPGGGVGAVNDYVGGSYGGWAGGSYRFIYGSVQAPTDPGSGGKSDTGATGTAGGGAVLIDAAGNVTVNGTINANGGGDGTTQNGSGGGIYIKCASFAGTNGVVSADAHTGNVHLRSCGGGGRIAVVYDPATQAGKAKPTVTFTANRGNGTANISDIGTIYFPDGAILDGTWMPHTGQIWTASASWDTASLVVSNGLVRFAAAGFLLNVTNNVTVSGTGKLQLGGNQYLTNSWPRAYELLASEPNGPVMTVGGNLLITNGGAFTVYAGMTNGAATNYGAQVTVVGDIVVSSNSWIYPHSHPTNGGSVVLRANNFSVLSTNAGVNANYRGFRKAGAQTRGWGPGGGGTDSGGGYGGVGAWMGALSRAGKTYGSSNAPVDPGSGGMGESTAAAPGANGGGSIRIHATNAVSINGILSADGEVSGNGYGSGSGGGIYITCRSFAGGTGGVIQAMGAQGRYSPNFRTGGGGGRIAIMRVATHDTYLGSTNAMAADTGGEGGAPSNGTVVILSDPNIPLISTLPGTNLLPNSADMVGSLTFTGASPTEVYVYWGTSDGGAVKSQWGTNSYMGVRNVEVITNSALNLSGSTKYYYRFYATNAAGEEWAPTSTNFTTPGASAVDNDGGATDLALTSARLRGQVTGGFPTPEAYVCWSTNNVAEASTSAWEHVVYMGEQAGSFATNITGLLASQAYYYRCFATNIYGGAWAAAVTNFTTLIPGMAIGDAQVIQGPSATTTNCIFNVTLSATSAVDATVGFATANGTAIGGPDFVDTNGTLLIEAGQVSKTITVVVNGNDVDEWPSKYFYVNLSSATNATLTSAQGKGTIIDTNDIAQTNYWTGTGNWTNPANWSLPGSLPGPADTVIIQSGSALLSAPQSIANLIVSNGATLIFTNWTTKLTVAQDVTVRNGGTITLPAAFTNTAMSNRVWIGCNNFMLETNANINADGKGFAGGAGTGHGPGGGLAYCGGTYGGRGGYWSTSVNPMPYGSLQAPTDPGSGGGGQGVGSGSYGGDAGGAIWIDAAGTVTANGTIGASGTATGWGKNGSGGSIYLICHTFAGTNGVIRANAGTGDISWSSGGGGRIAVIYDTAAQAGMAKPSVTFSAAPASGSSLSLPGDLGTIYFPDGAVLDGTWLPHIGQIWTASASWNTASLALSNGWIRLAASGFQLSVSNNVTVSGTGKLQLGGNQYLTNSFPRAYEFLASEPNGPSMTVGGNLFVTNGGALTVYAGLTNGAPTNFGAEITVAGDIVISTNSWIYPHSHSTNGGSVVLRANNFIILPSGTGGGINADYRGFRRSGLQSVGWGPGGGGENSGGGYGGAGAWYSVQSRAGKTYGSSNAPVNPGSGGGGDRVNNMGANGGGSIRIHAARNVSISGILTANGETPGSFYGGGSGGGIYITCRSFAGDASGVIRANGANCPYSTYYRAGGGGGRIAIKRVAIQQTYQGAMSVSADPSGESGPPPPGYGTITLLEMPLPGTIFMFR